VIRGFAVTLTTGLTAGRHSLAAMSIPATLRHGELTSGAAGGRVDVLAAAI
jgi:hypothetical protein